MTLKDTLIRYSFSTAGFFLVAIGIVLSVQTNIGISVLNVPAYAVSTKFPGLSLGLTNFIFYMLCVAFQIIILRKRFKATDLLQIPANFLLCYFINACTLILSFLQNIPESHLKTALLVISSVFISALGISMEVVAGAWMLPADMTVRALGIAFGGKFSDNKIKMDCTILIIGGILSLIFFKRILGPQETPTIGWGTLIYAIFIGLTMKLTTPLLQKLKYF